MATTKSRSTKARATKSTGRAKSGRPDNQSLPARAARTIRDRPYASAAIATGAVTAVAAAAAGAYFFSRSDKSLGELSDDLTGRVKDGLADAGEKIKKASAKARTLAADLGDKSQSEIAEEAISLKQTGEILDETNQRQTKTGAITY